MLLATVVRDARRNLALWQKALGAERSDASRDVTRLFPRDAAGFPHQLRCASCTIRYGGAKQEFADHGRDGDGARQHEQMAVVDNV